MLGWSWKKEMLLVILIQSESRDYIVYVQKLNLKLLKITPTLRWRIFIINFSLVFPLSYCCYLLTVRRVKSTPWCSSYRKGSLRVTLDYGRQLYLLIYHENRLTCWLDGQVKKLRQQTKVVRKEKHTGIYWDEYTETKNKQIENTTWKDKS